MQNHLIAASLFAVLGLGALAAAPFAQAETAQIASLTGPAKSTAKPDNAAVARIKAGDINCPHCDLSGSDLSNQCVKKGDLTGADFDNVKALYMCMSIANFTNATFRNADLTGANLGHSILKGADLTGTKLTITSIKGADLSTAKGLTQAQINLACGDADTKLPPGLTVKSCS
jgi:uncharacterized protein YjbI with pentapeptide repeats